MNVLKASKSFDQQLHTRFLKIKFSSSLTQQPIGYLRHAAVQKILLKSLLMDQFSRCFNETTSISRVHARMFEAYKSWCQHVKEKANFGKDKLQDCIDLLMLWGSSEQLRRVCSFVSFSFHYRHKHGSCGLWKDLPAFKLKGKVLKSVDCFEMNFDSVEDKFRQPSKNTCFHYLNVIWDNFEGSNAFPRAGGWLALACDFFFILKLHLWSCIVAVDVVRDTNRSRWAGVMDLVAHFRLKSAEVSTLHQLCLFDVGMLVLEQVVQVAATASLRIKHVVITFVCLKCMHLLELFQESALENLFSSVPPSSSSLPKERFIYIYLVARSIGMFITYAVRVSRLGSSVGFLPGAVQSQTGIRPKAKSCCKKTGWGIVYFCKSFGFWSLTLLIKFLFDIYILWPSAAGVTTDTLCASEAAQGSASGFSNGVACYTFVYFLWIVTFVMSLSTTYVSYVVSMSIFGNVIPHIFSASSSWERMWLVMLLVMAWFISCAALLWGSFLLAFSVAVLVVVISRALTIQPVTSWEQCRYRFIHQPGSQEVIPSQEVIASPLVEAESTALDTNIVHHVAAKITRKRAKKPEAQNSVNGRHMATALQCLFCKPLTIQQASLCWQAIIRSLYECDLLSSHEVTQTFSCDNFFRKGNDIFLSQPPKIVEAERRLMHFLNSLMMIRRRQEKCPSLNRMRSVTILVPCYNETVMFCPAELVKTDFHQSVSDLEFLVEKHKEEFNNFAKRIGYQSDSNQDQVDGFSPNSRELLDKFLAVNQMDPLLEKLHRSHDFDHQWRSCEEKICQWASLRGQTLYRTVHGLTELRNALFFTGEIEAEEGVDVSTLIDRKLQILIGAQIFGTRTQVRHRRDVKALMKMFPHIEIVYDFDFEKDLSCQIQKRREFNKESFSNTQHDSFTMLDSFRAEMSQVIQLSNDVMGLEHFLLSKTDSSNCNCRSEEQKNPSQLGHAEVEEMEREICHILSHVEHLSSALSSCQGLGDVSLVHAAFDVGWKNTLILVNCHTQRKKVGSHCNYHYTC
mmetsp:Transcript_18822/g.36842  ORF Transcript_18822/g.36842 Transcript_18822/m.36842 type:complete len:1020 (-) Transcript_18822:829-3888(-)